METVVVCDMGETHGTSRIALTVQAVCTESSSALRQWQRRGGRRIVNFSVFACLAASFAAVGTPTVGLLLLLSAFPPVHAVGTPVLHLAQGVHGGEPSCHENLVNFFK